jgi:hypothetical protein
VDDREPRGVERVELLQPRAAEVEVEEIDDERDVLALDGVRDLACRRCTSRSRAARMRW